RRCCDLHHQTAFASPFLRQYDTSYGEAIQATNVIRSPEPKPDGNGGDEHNGASRTAGRTKSIQDAGGRQLRSSLTFKAASKAASAGKRVEAGSPAYPTHECSNIMPDGTLCGERVAKSLSIRTHVCPRCGSVADRDENAARNMQWRPAAPSGTRGAACGGEPRTREALAPAECQMSPSLSPWASQATHSPPAHVGA
ncbi:MAG TPA: zinc ribbon domain-containing protein, partial [Ktedonobacterales bacterium]|nr:zinc ribbon domain-containing protein [Ktedonobacterales bacterium]